MYFSSVGGWQHYWQGKLYFNARVIIYILFLGVLCKYCVFLCSLQKGESVKKMREEVNIFSLGFMWGNENKHVDIES